MTKEMLEKLEQGLMELRRKLEEVQMAVLRQEGAVLLARELLQEQEEAAAPEGTAVG